MTQLVSNPEKLITVNFEPVEDFDHDQIPELLDAIGKARRGKRQSYGAYAVRGVSIQELESCMNCMFSTKRTQERESDEWGGVKGTQIHTDTGSRNSVTLHHTVAGSVEAAILVGSKYSGFIGDVIPYHDVAEYLFERGQIDSDQLSPPTQALRTTLNEGDLLIFDHSQPHIFRDQTDARRSVSYY